LISINKNQPLKQMSESTRIGFCNDNIAGILTLNSTIQSIAGSNTLTDSLNINNNFTVDPDGNTVIQGTLDVSGQSRLYGGLDIYGDFLVNGAPYTFGQSGLDLSGSSTFGTLHITNTLDVGNATTLNTAYLNQLVVNDTSILNILDVSGATTLAQLDVSGATSLDTLTSGPTNLTSSLNVAGVSRLHSLYATATSFTSLFVSGQSVLTTVNITGDSTLNTLAVSGNSSLMNLDVSGFLTVYKNSNLYSLNVNDTFIDSSGNVRVYTGSSFLGGLSTFAQVPNLTAGVNVSNGTFLVDTSSVIINRKLVVDSSGNLTTSGVLDSLGLTIDTLVIDQNGMLYADSTDNIILNGVTLTRLLQTVTILVSDISGSLNVGGSVAIQQNLDVSGSLNVGGSVAIQQNLDVSGSLALPSSDNLLLNGVPLTTLVQTAMILTSDLSGSLNVGGSLDVSGFLTLPSSDNLLLNGVPLTTLVQTTTILTSDLSSSLIIRGNLDVSGSVTVGQNLDISGSVTVGQNLDISGSVTVGQNLDISGSVTVGQNLDISGSVTVGQNLDVSGFLTLPSSDNLLLNGVPLTTLVQTTTILTSDLSSSLFIRQNLDVSGSVTVGQNLDISGSVTVGQNLDISGSVTVGQNLDVSGSLALATTDNLLLNGIPLTTLLQTATITNNDISGSLNIGQDLSVSGGVHVGGLYIDPSGNLSIDTSGTLYLGQNTLTTSGTGDTAVLLLNSQQFTSGFTGSVASLYVNNISTMNGPIRANGGLTVVGGTLTDELYVGLSRTTTNIMVDQSGLLTVNKDLLVPHGSIAYFADPLGIIINNSYLSVRYFQSVPSLYFNGVPINSLPVDIIGASIDISAGKFHVYPTGQTHIGSSLDVSGNLLVKGRATFLDSSGIFFTGNNYLNVQNGSLLVNGTPVQTGGSSYPLDISGVTLNISNAFIVDSSGNTTISGNTDISGNTTISGNTYISGNTDILENTTISGNTDISGTLVVHSQATFLDSSGIFFRENNYLNVQNGSLLVNGTPLQTGGSSYPSDISGTTLNISNTFTVDSSGNTDISGTLVVHSPATFLDPGGIYLASDNLSVSNGVLQLNGAPVSSGGSGSYPQDITAASLDVSSGKFHVYSTGQTHVGSSLDVSGISYLNGGADITGRFNIFQGTTKVLYYDYSGNQTYVNNLTVNPTGSFQAGSSGANSLIQILAGGSTVSLVNAQSANTICYPNTNNGVALAVRNTGIAGAINSTNPLVTIGDMTSLNDPLKLLLNDLVLKGNMYVEGNIQYTGSLTGQAGTGGLGWSDISAAIASELIGVNYLDISAGISIDGAGANTGTNAGIAGITNTVIQTYDGFTGSYLKPINPNQASTGDIINTLNMIIAKQNRIIAALLNKPNSGP
jgi:UDP-3-O-[3-hydroxymyristoyl] glucosamine N-acyltransferase